LIKYFLLFLFISTSLLGQTSSINGNVYDNKTKKPLAEAYVYFIKNADGVYTNKKGFFTIKSPDETIFDDSLKAKEACPVKIIDVKQT